MFYKVKAVTPLADFYLLVSFESGVQKQYDLKKLFPKWENFKSLTQVTGLFEQVRVEPGGYAVSWNDELDLSSNELYHNGIEL